MSSVRQEAKGFAFLSHGVSQWTIGLGQNYIFRRGNWGAQRLSRTSKFTPPAWDLGSFTKYGRKGAFPPHQWFWIWLCDLCPRRYSDMIQRKPRGCPCVLAQLSCSGNIPFTRWRFFFDQTLLGLPWTSQFRLQLLDTWVPVWIVQP